MKMTRCITRNPKDERVERWREEMGDKTTWIMQTEKLAPRYNNSWMIWRSLYRLRTKVGRCKANLKKWGYLEDPLAICECGEEQTMDHLLLCCECPITCSEKDLVVANQKAIDMAKYWSNSRYKTNFDSGNSKYQRSYQ